MSAPDTGGLIAVSKQLNIISLLTYLLPLGMGIWRWRYLSPAHKKILWFVLLAGIVLNSLSEIGRVVWHNNHAFVYLTNWAETLFLSWAFYLSFRSETIRRRFLWAVMAFGAVALVQVVFLRGPYASNTYARIAQCILLVGAALAYFEQTLQELRNIRLNQDPMFLVSTGVLIYFAGSLMVYVLEDSMYAQKQFGQVWIMYSIQFVLLIIFNLLLALALYRTKPTPQQVPSQL
ncbi:hypothetical protein [Hymenobacter cellulosilyticus]|uniref:Uncharacterized protein n=1 Tax=Hymenobacter cellulosilyticus TaxID=2932248 RepID=A0A8T9QAH6_9BACT|nr:hypothetical protein [Hymenobacter cellulosilyticus]UOQ74576.1 hypothetical protein MUN79_12295 [Hymenobacter cellulosilyticus]